jgi:small subunit ribosomal protein S12
MPTLRQLFKNPRKKVFRKSRTSSLRNCPQKRGIILRLYRVKPKKPNSAQRKVAKIRLCTNKTILVYLPGMSYGLYPQVYANVLIRGGRVRDLPGIRYKIIRGKYDSAAVLFRKQGRSKYGVSNLNKVPVKKYSDDVVSEKITIDIYKFYHEKFKLVEDDPQFNSKEFQFESYV